MQRTWMAIGLAAGVGLAGCASFPASLALSSDPAGAPASAAPATDPTPGGGGGGGGGPVGQAGCPADLVGALQRAVDALGDDYARQTLSLHVQGLDRIASGGSESMQRVAIANLDNEIDDLVEQQRLAPTDAAHLHALTRCWAP